ncbi:hypothetical protein BC332_08398 [Capsicum chinense]|nr:hypothetical protein BC332_08398 [Capsicum chinense]
MQPIDIQFHPLSIPSSSGHSVVVCNDPSSEPIGDVTSVVSWGWNQTSQLGREDPDNIPKVVEGLAGETPVSVLGGPACKEIMVSGNTWGYISAKHQYMVNNSKICACVKSDYTNS